jgi:hypothetical protein
MPGNLRQGGKCSTVTNIIAYCAATSIMTKCVFEFSRCLGISKLECLLMLATFEKDDCSTMVSTCQ